MSYDQFVREQLVGDLLLSPDGRPVNERGIGGREIANSARLRRLMRRLHAWRNPLEKKLRERREQTPEQTEQGQTT